jgi:hypothetical protein
VKRMKVPCINAHEDSNETHQTLFERGGKRERGDGNIMKGVNLFKVHCMELSQQNPLILLLCDNSKIK